jgi:outer membrane protein OmpA-like peptidoglycan-associated protein
VIREERSMSRTIDWPRYTRWTWIVAALLILLLAGLWFMGKGPASSALCCGASAETSQAVSAPPPPDEVVAPVAKTPGQLKLTADAGKFVLEGVVPDAAAKDRLVQAAVAIYGNANVVDKLTIDASVTAATCADRTDALFTALKTDPPIGVECDAQGITLIGTSTSEVDKAARETWAHEFFGADARIVNALQIAAPEQPVTRPEDVRCGARIPAAVTFATGSAHIAARGRKLLDAIAPCLKTGAYEIGGHTDAIGTAEDNMKLSRARAEAVRAYMILKGVDADRLIAVGYGLEHPIGDNATRDGRAKNRRIEFSQK